MVGDECYAMMRRIKETFDPADVFNPGKIIDTPPPVLTVDQIRAMLKDEVPSAASTNP